MKKDDAEFMLVYLRENYLLIKTVLSKEESIIIVLSNNYRKSREWNSVVANTFAEQIRAEISHFIFAHNSQK